MQRGVRKLLPLAWMAFGVSPLEPGMHCLTSLMLEWLIGMHFLRATLELEGAFVPLDAFV